MSDRKTHWENVYASKSPSQVSWYQAEPTLSLRLIKNTGIDHTEPVIDVGGGASLLVDHLLAEGYRQLAVLDIAESSLAFIKQRLGEKAELIEWFEADVTEFKAPHSFTVWHDRAVFHFLTQAVDREKYIAVLNRSLRARGQLILAAFAIGGPQKCSGLDIVQYDAEKLLAELGSEFELVEQVEETHLTPANKEQLFCYFRLIKKG